MDKHKAKPFTAAKPAASEAMREPAPSRLGENSTTARLFKV